MASTAGPSPLPTPATPLRRRTRTSGSPLLSAAMATSRCRAASAASRKPAQVGRAAARAQARVLRDVVPWRHGQPALHGRPDRLTQPPAQHPPAMMTMG